MTSSPTTTPAAPLSPAGSAADPSTGPATASGGGVVAGGAAAVAFGAVAAAAPAGARGSERVQRPWGWFETLAAATAADAQGARSGYVVKRLWIHPHSRISLQRHRQRSEHWVVVAGSGVLECGEASFQAEAGTCLEVPLAAVHRASAGAEGLLIIEVQRGESLREDDIERFADDYGRVIGSADNL